MTADENGRFGLYPPEPVSDIVDTNGAGDAFVGKSAPRYRSVPF